MKASDILSFNDLRTGEVEVEEWGCSLHIRELGLDEGLKLFSMVKDDESLDGEDIARVIAWGVIDPDTGERLFSDDDIGALSRKSRRALMRLYSAITDLSGEDAEKN